MRPAGNALLHQSDQSEPTLEIRANVSIEADDAYAFADVVGAKYGGAGLREYDGSGATRVKLVFEPVKVNVWGS
jgi:hypothetical protein